MTKDEVFLEAMRRVEASDKLPPLGEFGSAQNIARIVAFTQLIDEAARAIIKENLEKED